MKLRLPDILSVQQSLTVFNYASPLIQFGNFLALLTMTTKNYTNLGKWYAIISLILIAFFYNPIYVVARFTLPNVVSLALQGSNDRSLMGILVLFYLYILWIMLVVIGIVKDQIWAKWLAVVTYGLTIFVGFNSLTSLRNMATDTAVLTLTTALLLNVLPMLVIAILGIILILKKPTV